MKEFALKHPILTFLLMDSAIGGIVAIVKTVACAFGKGTEATVVTIAKEEEKENESSGDIH